MVTAYNSDPIIRAEWAFQNKTTVDTYIKSQVPADVTTEAHCLAVMTVIQNVINGGAINSENRGHPSVGKAHRHFRKLFRLSVPTDFDYATVVAGDADAGAAILTYVKNYLNALALYKKTNTIGREALSGVTLLAATTVVDNATVIAACENIVDAFVAIGLLVRT